MLFKDRFRYFIIFLIVLVALINYVDRGAIAYASSHILEEYGFDKEDWGKILGYFGFGYMFGALIGGALADKLGPKKVWLIAGVSWSIFEILTGWAGTLGLIFFGSALTGFAIIRILFGFTEGPAYSIINKTVSNWATSKERGFIVSIGLLSTPLGALITAPISVGLLLLTGDWRLMFVILGIVGLIALFILMRFFTDHPEQNKHVTQTELDEIRQTTIDFENNKKLSQSSKPINGSKLNWSTFFKSKTLVFNTIGYAAFIYVNFLLLTWTPKYLQDQFNYDLKSLWYMGMIPWIGACFTVILGGRISDFILRKTSNLWLSRSGFASISLLLTATTFLSIPYLSSPAQVILAMTIANAFNSLPNSVYWAVVIDTTPQNKVGTFSGMMHFFANISSVLAPTLTGYLVSQSGNYSTMFTAAGIATIIGMLAMVFVKPGRLSN